MHWLVCGPCIGRLISWFLARWKLNQEAARRGLGATAGEANLNPRSEAVGVATALGLRPSFPSFAWKCSLLTLLGEPVFHAKS